MKFSFNGALLLSLVEMQDMYLHQLDVKTIFLHGELDKKIYRKQPEGFKVIDKEDYACRSEKSLYSLKNLQRNGVEGLFLHDST